MVLTDICTGLNTSCFDSQCIFSYLDQYNISLPDVLAIPEQDEWRYSGNVSLVCSSFVLSCFKHAGTYNRMNMRY